MTFALRPDLPPPSAKWTGLSKHHFVGGNNDAGAVPVAELVAAATRALEREGHTLANYFMHSGPQGHRGLREFLVAKLARDAGIVCTVDELLITSGSLHGLDLVNAAFVAPGDTVIVERSTYGGSITRLQRLGARIVGVDVDADGLSAQGLSDALDALQREGVRPKFIYTIPTVHNPTATVMSAARRAEILALAHRHAVPIFEDDCYADLTWSGTRPPALYALDGGENVVHIGSFSKTVAPALRVGWIVARWPLMGHLLSLKVDGGSGALEQMTLAQWCPRHFDAHAVQLRAVLEAKSRTMFDALQAQFGDTIRIAPPIGGIFQWVEVADGIDTTRLAQAALQAGVAINPGAEWMTDPEQGRRHFRVCFAQPDHDNLREGVTRLAEVCHRTFGVPARAPLAHR
jgi:2-aminoadipate transaminase